MAPFVFAPVPLKNLCPDVLRNEAINSILNKNKAECDKIDSLFNRQVAQEKSLAETLSNRYGVPFIDAL